MDLFNSLWINYTFWVGFSIFWCPKTFHLTMIYALTLTPQIEQYPCAVILCACCIYCGSCFCQCTHSRSDIDLQPHRSHCKMISFIAEQLNVNNLNAQFCFASGWTPALLESNHRSRHSSCRHSMTLIQRSVLVSLVTHASLPCDVFIVSSISNLFCCMSLGF